MWKTRNSAGKSEGTIPLRGIRCYGKIILKWMSNREDGVVWINVVEAKDQLRVLSNGGNKIQGSRKDRKHASSPKAS